MTEAEIRVRAAVLAVLGTGIAMRIPEVPRAIAAVPIVSRRHDDHEHVAHGDHTHQEEPTAEVVPPPPFMPFRQTEWDWWREHDDEMTNFAAIHAATTNRRNAALLTLLTGPPGDS